MRKGYVIHRSGTKVPRKFVHMVHDSEAGCNRGMWLAELSRLPAVSTITITRTSGHRRSEIVRFQCTVYMAGETMPIALWVLGECRAATIQELFRLQALWANQVYNSEEHVRWWVDIHVQVMAVTVVGEIEDGLFSVWSICHSRRNDSYFGHMVTVFSTQHRHQ